MVQISLSHPLTKVVLMAGGEEIAARDAGIGWWSGRFDPNELAADRDALRAIGERFIAASEADLNQLPQAAIANVAVELVNASEQATRLTGAYMRNGERAQSHLANGEKSMVALVRAPGQASQQSPGEGLRTGTLRTGRTLHRRRIPGCL